MVGLGLMLKWPSESQDSVLSISRWITAKVLITVIRVFLSNSQECLKSNFKTNFKFHFVKYLNINSTT